MKCETASLRAPEPSKVPVSVPLSALLNIGKLITPKVSRATVFVEESNLQDKIWLPPFEVKVSLDGQPFASGSFVMRTKLLLFQGFHRARNMS